MSIWLLSNLRKILISSSAASAIIAICRYTSVDIGSRNFLATLRGFALVFTRNILSFATQFSFETATYSSKPDAY